MSDKKDNDLPPEPPTLQRGACRPWQQRLIERTEQLNQQLDTILTPEQAANWCIIFGNYVLAQAATLDEILNAGSEFVHVTRHLYSPNEQRAYLII